MADEDQGGVKVTSVTRHSSVIVAFLTGVAAFLLLTFLKVNANHVLIGWNVAAMAFIGISWGRMLRAKVADIRRRAEDLDFSDTLVLFLSIAAALASIAGIGVELHSIKDAAPNVAFAKASAAIVTILISWVFLHTLFTVHYAHRFYSDLEKGDGLIFPDRIEEPVYWDFLYFSFTIGVAAQTADVAVSSMTMRKITLLHAVLSFLFNTTILALAINVGASLL
jgi:uncharacterized membrane protein